MTIGASESGVRFTSLEVNLTPLAARYSLLFRRLQYADIQGDGGIAFGGSAVSIRLTVFAITARGYDNNALGH